VIITMFSVPGAPVSKARPRVTKAGHAFTPKKTRNYEALVKMCAAQAMKGKRPTDGPVAMEIVAVFPRPVTWPKWKQQLADIGEIAHTKKPDEDNIGKSVSDALNGVVYLDDAQVVRKEVVKKFECPLHDVGCYVWIRTASGHPCQIKMRPE